MRTAFTALVGLFLVLGPVALPAHAQLVMLHQNLRVVQVDRSHNRLLCTDQGQDGPQFFVDCSGDTRVFYGGHRISWADLHRGDILHVKSGLKWDGHLAGKSVAVERGRVSGQ